ncbi:helicase ARIP4-like [Panonychus citri]|uniref:helicase ARIP4-like n=1 Tax=Panonychus citri TaxID=50023 RepID=UPI0023080226|nr:helicase ARIP4-like [Panonychus citri]
MDLTTKNKLPKQKEVEDDHFIKRKRIRLIKETESEQTKNARDEELKRLKTNIDEIFLSSDDEDNQKQIVSSIKNHNDDKDNVPDENGNIRINVHHDDQPPIYVAEHLTKVLKPHQIGGIRFMYDNLIGNYQKFNSAKGLGCILAHSMGLGKTLQVICFVDIYFKCTKSKSIMIIVPVNVLNNWFKEFEIWLPRKSKQYKRLFEISIANTGKTNLEKIQIINHWKIKGGVLLIGFECFCKMVNESSLREALLDPGPDFVICDEGHRIKNNESKTCKQLKRIRTQRRLILTGTPLQNNLVEYWCMVDFVRPHFLGTKEEFINKFERPITNGQCINSTEHDKYIMKQQTHVLNKLIRGFIQRRNNDLLTKDLPDKFEYVIPVKSTDIQMKLMKKFLNVMITCGNFYNPVTLAAMLLKIWNHPDIYYDCFISQKLEPEIESTANSVDLNIIKKSLMSTRDVLENYKPGIAANSNKMLLLLTIVNETAQRNEKLLVFSQSLTTLSVIEKFLNKESFINKHGKSKHWKKHENYLRLDGTLLNHKKAEVIDKFNRCSKMVLLLISTKAGCLGINLTSANRLILYDTSWNPTNDSQASCRIYRYGQKKIVTYIASSHMIQWKKDYSINN